MFEKIWTYILAQISTIDPLTWVLLFFVSIVYDIVYTKSIIHISKLNAGAAANFSAILYFMIAFSTIQYIEQPFNVIPLIIGSWLGTYGILKLEKYKRDKRRKEKRKKES